MISKGPNTSGSAFSITLDKVPALDFRQVVFGKVVDGLSVLDKIEAVACAKTGVPKVPIVVSFCGVLTGKRPSSTKPTASQPTDATGKDLESGEM